MQTNSHPGVNQKGCAMADARMKKAFQEAAEIAQGVPEPFREAAFNRALDVLLGQGKQASAPREEEAWEEEMASAEGSRRKILGIPGSGFVLEKSVAALNLAAARLGLEEMSAEQVADALEENFGVHVSQGMVARALEQADSVVAKARLGGETLYRVIRPPVQSAHDRPSAEETSIPPKPKPKATAKPKSKAGAGGTKRKPAPGSTAASKKKSTT
jgi:hypothetical protein